MNKTILLTKKGMKMLRKQIRRLERERKRVIYNMRDVRRGANKDAMSVVELQYRLQAIDNKIYDQKQLMGRAKLLTHHKSNDVVEIGSVVQLKDMKGNMTRYQLVSTLEADPAHGKISTKSPLGQTLLGRKMNDIVAYTLGSRQQSFRLMGIA